MKPWQSVLGYQRGDSLERVQDRARQRLQAAVRVNNPRMAREIVHAWSQAKRNLSPPPSPRGRSGFLSGRHYANHHDYNMLAAQFASHSPSPSRR